jgi:hypothetical protein
MNELVKPRPTNFRFFFCSLLVISITILFGCGEKKVEIQRTAQFDIQNISSLHVSINKEKVEILDLSDFPTLIGQIKHLELFDDLVIIQDGELKSINLVTKEVKQLAKKGNGPYEYLSISAVKAYSSGIYFTDRRQMKLQKVSFEGEPIFEIDIDCNPSDFAILNDTVIAFFHGSHPFRGKYFRVSLFNINQEKHFAYFIQYPAKHYDFLHFDDWNNFTGNHSPMLGFSGNNDIYVINDKLELTPFLRIDFGNKGLTNEVLNIDYDEVFEFATEMDQKGVFCRFISTYETNNYLIFSTRVGSDWFLGSYSKHSEKAALFNTISFNDLDPVKIDFNLIPKGYFNNQIALILEPHNIINNPQLLEILITCGYSGLQPITKNSNPIVILINENSINVI